MLHSTNNLISTEVLRFDIIMRMLIHISFTDMKGNQGGSFREISSNPGCLEETLKQKGEGGGGRINNKIRRRQSKAMT